jgi:hypothetical protein
MSKHSVPLRNAVNHPLYLQEASPASHSVKPDEEKERTMTVISGRRCYGLFESSNPNGSSVKMLRDYLLGTRAWYSNKCALTWKVKVTKFNRSLYQLSPSTRRTGGIGSGLLPTATTQETEHPQAELTKTGRRKAANGNSHSMGLADKVAMLPTPTSRDSRGLGNEGHPSRDSVDYLIEKGTRKGEIVGKQTGLKLQPGFALWMMGYLTDWLDLKDGEMPPSKARGTHGSPK